MAPTGEDSGSRKNPRTAMYVEDALILLAIVALFVLGVFFRGTSWGQGGLLVVLAVMAVVLVRRFRRTHRAFTGRGGGD